MLNELIEVKNFQYPSPVEPNTRFESLNNALKEINELNERMLLFLRESKIRRVKRESAVKSIICGANKEFLCFANLY